jgi:DNA-binding CsgD family transcriptional regulator
MEPAEISMGASQASLQDTVQRLETLNRLGSGARSDDIAVELDRLRVSLSFDYLSMARLSLGPEMPAFADVSLDARLLNVCEAYIERGLHVADPTIPAVMSSSGVVVTNRYFGRQTPDDGGAWGQGMTELYREFGLASQAALRVDTVEPEQAVILCMGTFDANKAAEMENNAVSMQGVLRLASLAYLNALEREAPSGGSQDMILSPAERDVLGRLAQGATPQDVSEDTGKSISTVRKQMESARRRLGARTTSHAIALAIALELIRPR